MQPNEEQPSAWPNVDNRLREEAGKSEGFPPFLHRRIMAAVREEAQRSAQPKWVIFNWARLALAGGVAGFALFFALTPSVPTPEERASLPIGEWIATAAHSDQQVASDIELEGEKAAKLRLSKEEQRPASGRTAR